MAVSLVTVGRYQLHESLGEGAFAEVFRASREDGLEVALKRLRSELWQQAEFRSRFHREVRIYKHLSHPAIVRLMDWGEHGDTAFLALEYLQGFTLRQAMDRRGRLSLSDALGYLKTLFAAVDYAHTQGVIHRDLKPENVMVTDHGNLKVIDYGLALDWKHREGFCTSVGAVLGSPAYIAPEMLVGGAPATTMTDQYALGVMAFEMLAGQRPYDDTGKNALQTLMLKLGTPPRSLADFRPDLPLGIDQVIQRMLAAEPDERFPFLEDALLAWGAATQGFAPEEPFQPIRF